MRRIELVRAGRGRKMREKRKHGKRGKKRGKKREHGKRKEEETKGRMYSGI